MIVRAGLDDQGLANTILALSSTGYRPWFAYVKEGEKMDVTDSVRFWDNADTPKQSDAEAVMAESCSSVFSETDPTILEGIYISAKSWTMPLKGKIRLPLPCACMLPPAGMFP